MIDSLSPIDGRYHSQTRPLVPFLSEYGLMKYRVQVEVEYFIFLTGLNIGDLPFLAPKKLDELRQLYLKFKPAHAEEIKEIEKVTNHDVKAVEYFLKNRFEELELSEYKEYIHFGLTSQDINNTAIPMSIKDAAEEVIYPFLEGLIEQLEHKAEKWESIPMLARTHGQPASPTKLGKEILVFTSRLKKQFTDLKALPFYGKFGGATGNFNAHYAAFPFEDWHENGNKFLGNSLGLERLYPTTQIEHYDGLAAWFQNLNRIATILIDLSRDFWTYISMDYFKQKTVATEVGSSAMPHKVNPIDFENAEGNLGLVIAIGDHLANKLPVSRLQRDLTDSTVLRNVSVPFSHFLIALKSLTKGLNKIELNEAKIQADLNDNWAVVAEAIQTILRREKYPNPYEALKNFTRGQGSMDVVLFLEFIDQLDVSKEVKKELKSFTPMNYTGK
jgi:adenylosuccinate lyase